MAESLKKFWFETNLQKTQVTKAYSVVQSLKPRELRVFLRETLNPRLSYDFLLFEIDFPGGHIAGVTPVPIPNTEVKPR